MRIYDILSYLESRFPISSQASFDNCGLLLGDGQDSFKGALICLDCTEEIIDEAILLNSNLIIAHHPIIFNGIKNISQDNYVNRVVLKAIKHNVCIYAIHTNLDHSRFGVNFEIANRLGIKNTEFLSTIPNSTYKLVVYVPITHEVVVRKAMFESGAGEYGDYSSCSFSTIGKGTFLPNENSNPFIGERNQVNELEEVRIEVLVSKYNLNDVITSVKAVHPYEEIAYDILEVKNDVSLVGSGMFGELDEPIDCSLFLGRVKEIFKCGVIRHTQFLPAKVKRIAWCGGAGSFLIQDAIKKKADIYLTGDIKYHEFFDADKKIVIADIGHYESEQFTSELIYRSLTEKFINFAFNVTKNNTNPINYF
jgi:dinuclear metal center YbgI/SA1388 family protein